MDMSPNIQKFIVPLAVEFFGKSLTAERFPRQLDRHLFPHPQKRKKSLDFMLRDPLFHHLSFHDLMLFGRWDLLCNEEFHINLQSTAWHAYSGVSISTVCVPSKACRVQH